MTRSYTFVGVNSTDLAGASVSSAGDVDGDGLNDLLIGARFADGGGAAPAPGAADPSDSAQSVDPGVLAVYRVPVGSNATATSHPRIRRLSMAHPGGVPEGSPPASDDDAERFPVPRI